MVAGVAMMLYGAGRLVLGEGGAFAVLLASVGLVLTATHWGWVHVAEYIGLTVDDRRERALEARRQEWLADLEPYPRYSVSTSVLDDASTRVACVLHRPVLTPDGTFTFVCEVAAQRTFDPEASAALIAATVETMRRQARRQTDGLCELWRDAAATYAAALSNAHDERERVAARRVAALALSAHINASLLEPPLVE